MKIPLDDIDADAIATRAPDRDRARDNIERYRHAYERGDPMPPLEIYQSPDHGWVLVDGWHRYFALVAAREAKHNAGEPTVRYEEAECEIVGEGTVEDAHRYALEHTNQRHGLRLSDGDKQERARQALVYGLYGDASDRRIAERLGVSHTLVGHVRRHLEAEGELAPAETRESKDGRHRPGESEQRGGGRRRDDTGRLETTFQSGQVPAESSTGCDRGLETTFQSKAASADAEGGAAAHPADNNAQDRVRSTAPDAPSPDDTERAAENPTHGTSGTDGPNLPGFTGALEQLTAEARQLRLHARRAQREHPALTGIVNSAIRSLQNAESVFRFATPVPCPWCCGAGCGQCHERGYVDHGTARSAEQTRKRTGRLPGTGGSAA